MKHEGITKDIIGAAMAVLNELKPGLDEKLYENALLIELAARGHTVEQQRSYPVHYRTRFIGKLVPDLIVDGNDLLSIQKWSPRSTTRTSPRCLATSTLPAWRWRCSSTSKESNLGLRGGQEENHGLHG